MGLKVDSKSKLIRQLGETVDLSSFDFQSGRNIPNPQQSLLHQQPVIRSANMQRSIIEMLPSSVPPNKHPLSIEYRCLDSYIAYVFFSLFAGCPFVFSLPIYVQLLFSLLQYYTLNASTFYLLKILNF